MGLEFGIAVVVFFLGGRALDAYLGTTKPWMSVLGALLGVGLGMYLVLRPLIRGTLSDSPTPEVHDSPEDREE